MLHRVWGDEVVTDRIVRMKGDADGTGMTLAQSSTELPSVAAVDARDECRHRFVGAPRLQLVKGGLALFALATLREFAGGEEQM